MRSLLIFVCTVALALALAPVAAAEQTDERPRIAVIQFENKAEAARSWWYGNRGAQQLQDVFVTELVRTGRFRVIERERLEELMREQNLSVSGAIDTATAIEIGRLLGVEYLLAGAVTEYGMREEQARARRIGSLRGIRGGRRTFEAAINARLINTTTGEIMWADEARETTSHGDLQIGGYGAGRTRDDRMFDQVMRPCVEQLVQSMRVANL